MRDLIAVTEPDVAETPTPEPKDVPDEMIADSGEMATWDEDDEVKSAPGPATEVLEALKNGVNDYIVKPFTKPVMVEKINKVLGI